MNSLSRICALSIKFLLYRFPYKIIVMSSNARSGRYEILSDKKKDILSRLYDEGMVGTGKKFDHLIDRACEETGLSKAKVQVRCPRTNIGSRVCPYDLLASFRRLMGACF